MKKKIKDITFFDVNEACLKYNDCRKCPLAISEGLGAAKYLYNISYVPFFIGRVGGLFRNRGGYMIIEKLPSNKVKFSDVMPGQVFEWCDCIYIKPECTAVLLKDIDGLASINAVGLNRGVYTHFNDNDEVIIHNTAKVVLI